MPVYEYEGKRFSSDQPLSPEELESAISQLTRPPPGTGGEKGVPTIEEFAGQYRAEQARPFSEKALEIGKGIAGIPVSLAKDIYEVMPTTVIGKALGTASAAPTLREAITRPVQEAIQTGAEVAPRFATETAAGLYGAAPSRRPTPGEALKLVTPGVGIYEALRARPSEEIPESEIQRAFQKRLMQQALQREMEAPEGIAQRLPVAGAPLRAIGGRPDIETARAAGQTAMAAIPAARAIEAGIPFIASKLSAAREGLISKPISGFATKDWKDLASTTLTTGAKDLHAEAIESGIAQPWYQEIKKAIEVPEKGKITQGIASEAAKDSMESLSKEIQGLQKKSPDFRILPLKSLDNALQETMSEPSIADSVKNRRIAQSVYDDLKDAYSKPVNFEDGLKKLSSLNKLKKDAIKARIAGDPSGSVSEAMYQNMIKDLSNVMDTSAKGISGTDRNPFRLWGGVNEVYERLQEAKKSAVSQGRRIRGEPFGGEQVAEEAAKHAIGRRGYVSGVGKMWGKIRGGLNPEENLDSMIDSLFRNLPEGKAPGWAPPLVPSPTPVSKIPSPLTPEQQEIVRQLMLVRGMTKEKAIGAAMRPETQMERSPVQIAPSEIPHVSISRPTSEGFSGLTREQNVRLQQKVARGIPFKQAIKEIQTEPDLLERIGQ